MLWPYLLLSYSLYSLFAVLKYAKNLSPEVLSFWNAFGFLFYLWTFTQSHFLRPSLATLSKLQRPPLPGPYFPFSFSFYHFSKFCVLLILFLLLSIPSYWHSNTLRAELFFYFILYPQCLGQYLVYSKCLFIEWMDGRIN